MSVPKDLRYTKDHEWAKVDGDKILVGITDFAQKELGDIVFIELPSSGKSVTKGGSFAVVESVKAASDIYSPVDGEVVERNEKLTSKPELINSSPYDEAWMIAIRPTNKDQINELMTAEGYTTLLSGK